MIRGQNTDTIAYSGGGGGGGGNVWDYMIAYLRECSSVRLYYSRGRLMCGTIVYSGGRG